MRNTNSLLREDIFSNSLQNPQIQQSPIPELHRSKPQISTRATISRVSAPPLSHKQLINQCLISKGCRRRKRNYIYIYIFRERKNRYIERERQKTGRDGSICSGGKRRVKKMENEVGGGGLGLAIFDAFSSSLSFLY